MLLLIFLVPPLCWVLAVRRPRIRLGVGLILVVIAVAELAVGTDRLLLAEKTTVLLLLVVADAVILLSGMVIDEWRGAGTQVSQGPPQVTFEDVAYN